MKVAFALIAIFWWIAVWGLSDLLTENWSRSEKFYLYIAILIGVALVVQLVPSIMDRL